jgi:hypothetical protein
MATLLTAVSSELHGCNPEHLLGNVNLTTGFDPRRDESTESISHAVTYQIGGISFGMFSHGDVLLALDSALRDFEVPSAAPENCDVNIRVSLVDQLPAPQLKPLFHSGGLWSIFEERRDQQDGYRLNFQRSFPGETPYKSVWFDRNFTTGHLQLSRLFFPQDRAVYPLEYPLDEVLMIHRLACGQGLEVHAVGIVDELGRGHLFLGHSGAGKSTTARLWLAQPNIRILSDDRIVLRRQDGQIRMYGTPWHGDAGISSPHSAPVTNIFFLEQYRHNEILSLAPGFAAAEFFARSFVPRHCAQGLEFALSFIESVTREIPCNLFRFVPQQSAVEAIRHARD